MKQYLLFVFKLIPRHSYQTGNHAFYSFFQLFRPSTNKSRRGSAPRTGTGRIEHVFHRVPSRIVSPDTKKLGLSVTGADGGNTYFSEADSTFDRSSLFPVVSGRNRSLPRHRTSTLPGNRAQKNSVPNRSHPAAELSSIVFISLSHSRHPKTVRLTCANAFGMSFITRMH